ncbi:TPA: transposase [Yersinia enterocolitica]
MSGKRYSDKFKAETVRRVIEHYESVPTLAAKLGITTHSLYTWVKKHNQDTSRRSPELVTDAEIDRLKKALERVTAERDALKKVSAYFSIQRD